MILHWYNRFSSFTYLNVTQFLGALNDNIYKLLTVYLVIYLEGIENSPKILALTGAIFVLPFLLFSASSGTLADRFSKRDIIVLTKIFELITMGLAVIAFAWESALGAYTILFLLAVQSAIFGPSKYAIIPELVESNQISKANGLMTSFTFLAIILGTFLASFFVDITGKNFVLSSTVCTVVALIGMCTSFCIEHTPPAGSTKQFTVRFLWDIYQTLLIARQQPSLLAAICGSAYFLFLGAYVQLNMIPFAVEALNLTDVQGGYLFLVVALGIGCGSVTAGKISGKQVELGMVPLAGLGISIGLYILSNYSTNLPAVITLIGLVGVLGGIFQVPLDSYIQVASPSRYRGQIIAATNFLSFFGVLLASGLLYTVSEILDLRADKGFALLSLLTLMLTALLAFQFFDYVTRFLAMILSRFYFKISFYGRDNLLDSPVIYVCHQTSWNDTLLILGSQRRRMRFFIEAEQPQTSWARWLYKLLKAVFIPEVEPLEKNQTFLENLRNTLSRGISVCIFVDKSSLEEEIQKLQQSPYVCEVFDGTDYPIIPVLIQKGDKKLSTSFWGSLFKKMRLPAHVAFGEKIGAVEIKR